MENVLIYQPIFKTLIPGLPPSVNHYLRMGRNRQYLSKPAKKWIETSQPYFTRARGKTEEKKISTPIAQPVRLQVLCCSLQNRKWDLDNRLKMILDSVVKENVLHDDEWIYEIKARKMYRDEFIKLLKIFGKEKSLPKFGRGFSIIAIEDEYEPMESVLNFIINFLFEPEEYGWTEEDYLEAL